MKLRTETYIITTYALLAIIACTGGGNTKHMPQPSDSMCYTEQTVLDTYDSLPERALLTIDSAVIVGNMPDYRADLLRAKVYCSSCQKAQYDSAIAIGERLLRNDSVKARPDMQGDVLSILMYACHLRHDDKQALRWAVLLSQLYRQRGETTEALRTDAEIGKFLVCLGEHQKGLARIDSVVNQLYATSVHAAKQQEETDRQRAYKQYAAKVACFIGMLALLGLSFAWFAVHQWRKTQLKNRALARQIKEAIIYKDRYEKSLLQPLPTEKGVETAADETGGDKSACPSAENLRIEGGALDKLSPEELFRYLEHEVSRRLLFLNPQFDRQMIMDEFHLSKERVGAAFAQGSKYYDSLPQFVNDLRLEYASKLLVTTDLSISDIMAKAGYSNASVFSRNFSRKFQISPTQYRRVRSTT